MCFTENVKGGSILDKQIKGTLICDILHLIGIVATGVKGSGAKSGQSINERESFREKQQQRKKTKDKMKTSLFPLSPKESIPLSSSDWEIIYDLEDEYARRGNFFRT